VIRLAGTNRYTTPYQDGSFTFYNLREGEYEVVFDEQTLPEGYLLASPARMRVLATNAKPPAESVFELKLKPVVEKPIREILQEQIHLGVGGGAARGGSRGGGHGGGGGSR
jgi:uncharacterized membrane protein YgcG